eukprot:jgi/Chrzof1/11925/Cz06g14250.t1
MLYPDGPCVPDQLDFQQQKRRRMEDELRDPKNFVEYFLPRPLRLAFLGGSAVSCFIASLLSAARLIQEPAVLVAEGIGPCDLLINIIGMTTFGVLFYFDNKAADARVQQRKRIRDAQIAFGDRELYVNEQGEKMSRLKEVNDDWILRRLERWGKRDAMPFLGPGKGAILQQLVRDKQPQLAVEVGTMAGYSAILIAQALPPSSCLISIEKDLTWVLVAKRFLWQSSQGEKKDGAGSGTTVPVGQKVDVWWGDAVTKIPDIATSKGRIDLLFVDGTPKESLQYLQAAEPYLARGALVIADNAGVFAEGGMKKYLEYVRNNPKYSSKMIDCKLEWQDDVADGIEVSTYQGQ